MRLNSSVSSPVSATEGLMEDAVPHQSNISNCLMMMIMSLFNVHAECIHVTRHAFFDVTYYDI